MKKFVAISLAIAFLFDISTTSFALDVKIESNGLCSAKFVKPDKYPWSSKDMQLGCLGVAEVKINDPSSLMLNSEMPITVNEEPLQFFNSLLFFIRTPKRKDVNKFKLDGVKKKASWYNLPGKLINWLFDRRVTVSYRIVPISKAEAKPFFASTLKRGDKKPEKKAKEEFLADVAKTNGQSKMAELSEQLIKKALEGLTNQNVDPYDPYNAAQQGNLGKYAAWKDPISTVDYYSQEEAGEINKQVSLQKIKVCDELKDKSESELKKFGLIGTLSAESPAQYFAIVVNNKIDGQPEAYKLFNLLEANGYDFLKADKSILELRAQNLLKMPENSIPVNKERIAEVQTLIDSTKEKPGFGQWCKNLVNLAMKTTVGFLHMVIPNFLVDFLVDGTAAGYNLVANKVSQAGKDLSKVPPQGAGQQQAQPAGQQQNGGNVNNVPGAGQQQAQQPAVPPPAVRLPAPQTVINGFQPNGNVPGVVPQGQQQQNVNVPPPAQQNVNVPPPAQQNVNVPPPAQQNVNVPPPAQPNFVNAQQPNAANAQKKGWRRFKFW